MTKTRLFGITAIGISFLFLLYRTYVTKNWMPFLELCALETIFAVGIGWFVGPFQEQKRIKIVKHAALNAYTDFKMAFIPFFLAETGIQVYDPKKFMNVVNFRELFGSDSENNVWHQASNSIESDFHNFMLYWTNEANLLKDQLMLLLNKINSSNEEAYMAVDSFCQKLQQLQNAKTELDGVKSVMKFFYELFAGWNLGSGYKNFDQIERAIQDI